MTLDDAIKVAALAVLALCMIGACGVVVSIILFLRQEKWR